jgi:hypothetical protein
LAKLEVSRREFYNAFKAHRLLYTKTEQQSNASLTCLFYAIECGLKSIIMKRECREVSGSREEELSHDINKMLNALSSPQVLLIDNQIQLKPLKNPDRERKASQKYINQVLRYGMTFHHDEMKNTLAEKLTTIMVWIEGELK